MYSLCNPNATDNRTLLANALESTVKNEDEKKLLATYKSQIDILNKQQNELANVRQQIKDISFGKGTDRSKLTALKEKAITVCDFCFI